MHFSSAAVLASIAAVSSAAPFVYPLSNGFPNPGAGAIKVIETNAGGTLPNTPLPQAIQSPGVTSLQLIALNEIFEVAYFTELLRNISSGVEGYDTSKYNSTYVHESLFQIRAQEELHALAANAALMTAGEEPIQPCKYDFPVDNFDDAIALAATFTDVVLGTLPVAQVLFAEDGGAETGFIPLIGSVIAQEGEQTGVYRLLQKKKPSAAPFLTGGSPDFAFTALQSFIVPGSCPNIKNIGLTTFKPLTVIGTPMPENMTLKYSVEGTVTAAKNSIVYISGQNFPVTVPIQAVSTTGGTTTFEAEFPFEAGFAKGLTIAALVSGTGSFSSPNDVAASTIYGPGLIEID